MEGLRNLPILYQCCICGEHTLLHESNLLSDLRLCPDCGDKMDGIKVIRLDDEGEDKDVV